MDMELKQQWLYKDMYTDNDGALRLLSSLWERKLVLRRQGMVYLG